MIAKESLLEAYKTYDYLNADAVHPTVKIFVSYIKPSFLFKSGILTPIHLGRAVETADSKDGPVSETDLQWLHQNCIGDDDVEGSISALNRRIGFFTGTYWAWKNYYRLGEPDFFGSFGYRKLLAPSFLESLDSVDLVVPRRDIVRPSVKGHLDMLHGSYLSKVLADVLKEVHPDEVQDFARYFAGDSAYWHELYVMRRDLFFQYCEWVNPILERLLWADIVSKSEERCDDESLFLQMSREKGEKRDIAFLMERVTGFWLSARMKDPKIRGLESPLLKFGVLEERMQYFRAAARIFRRRI